MMTLTYAEKHTHRQGNIECTERSKHHAVPTTTTTTTTTRRCSR